MRRVAVGAVAVVAVAAAVLLSVREHGPRPRLVETPPPARARPGLRPLPAHRSRAAARADPAAEALSLPPVDPGPVPGYVLIADRNADKLLIVSPAKRIVWQFPRPGDLRRGESFHDPDDAFFAPGYRRIVTNEEFNDLVAEIDVRTHRLVWTYGRAGVAGSSSGELSNPDDAYLWPNGTITVADIKNCRVVRISRAHRIVGEVGGAGCAHDPPHALASPNGATPLPDGGMLITEIGGWVDRLDRHGRVLFATRTPTGYPSDAQLLPNGDVLVAGFDTPGRVDEITPSGRIVWTYGPSSGPGALDRPSLAVRWPNGMIAITDDWHHRIVVVDPRTKKIVWQYGHDGIASADPGYLSKPDGLDLLAAPSRPAPRPLRVHVVGSLPAPASRLAVAPLPHGRVLVAGGLLDGSSSRRILAGTPRRLRQLGLLPAPAHDAALAVDGEKAFLFGGGEAVSTDAIVRIDTRSGAARRAGSIGEPLSDLGAAVLRGRIYLVGGYTGSRFASGVLLARRGRPATLAARLPAGTRYSGVAALGHELYVAGGVTTGGETASVFAVDPVRRRVSVVATLPAPVAHAPLVALGRALYLVGGTDSAGAPVDRILRIEPETGAVTVAGHLPRPLADAAAVRVGDRVVVFGGTTPAPSRAILAIGR